MGKGVWVGFVLSSAVAADVDVDVYVHDVYVHVYDVYVHDVGVHDVYVDAVDLYE